MIISRGRRYIFVHIPKTGGTSLSLALEKRAMADDILIGDTPKAVRRRARVKELRASGRLWKHSTLSDIDGLVSPDEQARFFVLTLVRNPWDRLVSYYHWLRAQTWDHVAVDLAKSLTFSDFLAHPILQGSIAGAPYSSYVTDAHGVERCNLFARIEILAEDLAPFEAHLGFDLGDVERVNASSRCSDYRSFYSDDKAALVAQLCRDDIARFGYRF